MALTRVFLNYHYGDNRQRWSDLFDTLVTVGFAVDGASRVQRLFDLLDDRSTVPMIAVTCESSPQLATPSGVIQHLMPDLDNCRRDYRTEQDRALSAALPSSRFAPELQTWLTTVVAAAQQQLVAFKIAVAALDHRYSEVLRLARRLEAKLDLYSQRSEGQGQPELRLPELTHGLPWPARRALIVSPVGAGKTSSLLRAVADIARLRITLAVTHLTSNAVSNVEDGWPLLSTAIAHDRGRLSATSIDHRLDGFTGAEPIGSSPTPSAEDGVCNHSEDALHPQVWLAGRRHDSPRWTSFDWRPAFAPVRSHPEQPDPAQSQPHGLGRNQTNRGNSRSNRRNVVSALPSSGGARGPARPRSARPQTLARSAHPHGRLATFRALTVPLSSISR
ncbi:hypothetical protein AB0L41_49055 [Amycolatopsis mediterranei]|uniref:hypothetical protein n=1 Tax=Amycolatopsis mediterranei TaxID=33910 RepID=UPI003421E45A